MKVFTLLVLLFLSSCGYRTTEKSLKWKLGDSLSQLQEFESETQKQNWSDKNTVEFGDYEVVQANQVIDGVEVFGTQYRKVSNKKKSEIIKFDAQYVKQGIIPLSESKTDRNELLTQFKLRYPEYRYLNLNLPEPILVKEKFHIVSLWKILAELKMEAVEILFYQNTDLYSTRKISSDFSLEAKIYPRGPKRSDLTDVLLSDLSNLSKLSSSRVIVDSGVPNSELNLKEPLVYSPNDLRFEQVQAYFNLDSSLKWFEQKFNFKPIRKIEATVHFSYPEKTNAAFYYSGKIKIGMGDGVYYAHLAQDPSIVIHESAHTVIEAIARLPMDGEGGSLNEGFADFFAAAQLDNPYMGEVAFLGASYKRSLLTKVSWGEKNGGLYHDSLILSGLLWEFYKTFGEQVSLKIASRLLIEMNPLSTFTDLKGILPTVLSDILEPGNMKIANQILQDRGF